MNKTCTKCKVTKPVGEFYKAKLTHDGLRSNCAECVRAAAARYRIEHTDEVTARDRARVRDPEAVRRDSAKWRAANADRAREIVRRNRARKFDADLGPVDIEAVWIRDASVCYLCTRLVDRAVLWPDPMSPSLDHILPLSKGGLHVLDNVALAHLGCNQHKGDRTA